MVVFEEREETEGLAAGLEAAAITERRGKTKYLGVMRVLGGLVKRGGGQSMRFPSCLTITAVPVRCRGGIPDVLVGLDEVRVLHSVVRYGALSYSG